MSKSQKLPVNNFEWFEDNFQFKEVFIKTIRIFSRSWLMIYRIYQKEWKLKTPKSSLLISHDNTEYVNHIRHLKQSLNHGIVLKKFHRQIKFNQKTCLKSYNDMNTKLRKKSKNWFWERLFSSWWIMQFLEKLYVRKRRDMELVTTETRKTYLVSKSNYDTTKFFWKMY